MSSNPRETSSVASEDHGAAIPDLGAAIPDAVEGAVGGVSASNETNSGGGVNVTNSGKVITLFGGFSRIEHPQYCGPDPIQKGKKIMDHIADIREVIQRR